jgi:nucleotide-binding universal stress UspA family protein
MLGSILIGLDTSTHAAALLELGIRWAKQPGATLVGLGIADQPGIQAIEPAFPVGGTPGVDPVYYRGYEARLADVRGKVEHLLQEFAARCVEAGVRHEGIQAVGSPHHVIEREAQACDLLLLASRVHFRFMSRGDATDDTLKKVLRNAARPVVVVPAHECPAGPVVIAYDGSLQAARGLAAFQATGLAETGQVHLVCVASDGHSEAAGHVRRARQFLKHHQVEAVPHVLEPSAAPAQLILDQVRRLGADLLVMGAYGQPVLREFFVGSVTHTALGECPVPLFLYH